MLLASLMVKTLATSQEVLFLNPGLGLVVCSEFVFNFNRDQGLFSPRLQKMTITPLKILTCYT